MPTKPKTTPAKPKTAKPDEKPADGVLIVKVVADDGSIHTDPIPIGNVQATEVATLIELGLAAWRAKIGLDA